jgi:hypothetical protein
LSLTFDGCWWQLRSLRGFCIILWCISLANLLASPPCGKCYYAKCGSFGPIVLVFAWRCDLRRVLDYQIVAVIAQVHALFKPLLHKTYAPQFSCWRGLDMEDGVETKFLNQSEDHLLLIFRAATGYSNFADGCV